MAEAMPALVLHHDMDPNNELLLMDGAGRQHMG